MNNCHPNPTDHTRHTRHTADTPTNEQVIGPPRDFDAPLGFRRSSQRRMILVGQQCGEELSWGAIAEITCASRQRRADLPCPLKFEEPVESIPPWQSEGGRCHGLSIRSWARVAPMSISPARPGFSVRKKNEYSICFSHFGGRRSNDRSVSRLCDPGSGDTSLGPGRHLLEQSHLHLRSWKRRPRWLVHRASRLPLAGGSPREHHVSQPEQVVVLDQHEWYQCTLLVRSGRPRNLCDHVRPR